MDDPQSFINWLGAIAGALFGWIMKSFKDDLKTVQDNQNKLQAQQQTHEVHIARGYVTRAELQDSITSIEEKLDKIFDKLDGKEDRRRQ